MLPHRHLALSKVLYGEEHGFGKRILELLMVSGQDNLDNKMLVFCRYKYILQVLIAHADKNEWVLLCDFVAAKSHVKVILDDGTRDH